MKITQQKNTMVVTKNNYSTSISAYENIIEQHVIDASFLWLLRSQVSYNSTVYYCHDIEELDQRIIANLDAIISAGALGWKLCLQQLLIKEVGEIFITSVLALQSKDLNKLTTVLEVVQDDNEFKKSVVSAVGWLSEDVAHYWIKLFTKSTIPLYQYLGIAACSIKRFNPDSSLQDILINAISNKQIDVQARCLRLIGELKRYDLIPYLMQELQSENEEIKFWSNWSIVLLGERSYINNLKPFVFNENKYFEKALLLVFSALPIDQAKSWVNELAEDISHTRTIIKAVALIGDINIAPWLIQLMHESDFSRVAALSFNTLTNIDIKKQGLTKVINVDFNNMSDSNVEQEAINIDNDLPWPDADKLQIVWQKIYSNFNPNDQYFMGNTIDNKSLNMTILNGNQLQRNYAALKSAMLELQTVYINTATPKVTI